MNSKDIPRDAYGPEEVFVAEDTEIGMRGFLVIDNTRLGPGKGGIRMTPTISREEVFRLARTMTWKNALAGIPFGGAKGGIVWNGGSEKQKESVVRSFARAIKKFIPHRYIGGPDVNTGEREMKWIAEELGEWNAVTGKPADFCRDIDGKKQCGLPHELGSTGFGIARAAVIAAQRIGIDIKGSRVAIEGYGNVGSFSFQFLEAWGAKIVAIANRDTTLFNESGIDGKRLAEVKASTGSINGYEPARILSHDEIFGLPVDILIPAAVTDVIHALNKDAIKAKIIIEGANIPMKESIEDELSQKGICIVPDFVANAGGVISSYAEYKGMNAEDMFRLVDEKISASTRAVLARALETRENPRHAALTIAKAKVEAVSETQSNPPTWMRK